jgi:hypothetical protein
MILSQTWGQFAEGERGAYGTKILSSPHSYSDKSKMSLMTEPSLEPSARSATGEPPKLTSDMSAFGHERPRDGRSQIPELGGEQASRPPQGGDRFAP